MSQQEWAAAWVAAWAELPEVLKTKKAKIDLKSGGKYEYTYADLGDTLNTVRPILAKHGLAVSQSVTGDRITVAVETVVTHKAGWSERFGPTVLEATGDARATGSAITYARRYGLSAALGLATEDDDDGAQAEIRRSTAPAAAKADWHERAWSHCIGLFGNEPDLFLEMLAVAKVKGKIKDQAQYDMVVAALDARAEVKA